MTDPRIDDLLAILDAEGVTDELAREKALRLLASVRPYVEAWIVVPLACPREVRLARREYGRVWFTDNAIVFPVRPWNDSPRRVPGVIADPRPGWVDEFDYSTLDEAGDDDTEGEPRRLAA